MKTLFPPIVQSSLPAFDSSTALRFYYKPSRANTIEQANHAQIVINYVETNRSSLSSTWSSFEIMFADINPTPDKNGWYYIDIPTSEFPVANKGYKVQIRLSEIAKPTTVTSDWLNNPTNLDKFSEWSSVCVVMPITKPVIGVQGLSESSTTNLTTGAYSFIANYSADEPVQKYKFDVFEYTNYGDENTWTLLESSDEVRVGRYERQTIVYHPKTNFSPSTNYVVKLSVLTKNRYLSVQNFRFTVTIPDITNISSIIATNIYSRGQIEVQIESGSIAPTTESIIVKRTSIKSNFKEWEHVQTIDKPTSMTRFTFVDSAVEQGIVYQYGAQVESAEGNRSPFKISENTMCDYEDAFIVGEGGKLLRLRFDCQVAAVRNNKREARVETLGSKYPYIIKNSSLGYDEFSISALLTHFMDVAGQFFKEDMLIDEKYQDGTFPYSIYTIYQLHNQTNRINSYNDTLIERKFKEDVLEFLRDGKPKLFKSPTEGLKLVRLLDISYNPTLPLAGLTSNLSMTAVQIADVTDENLFKYGIIE